MIYFFYGDDAFRLKERVAQLKEKFISLYDPGGHNVVLVDNDDFTLEGFQTAARASGFLTAKKLVMLKNIFWAEGFADAQDAIIGFLGTQKNTKEENYILFWQEDTPAANLKLSKYLLKRCDPKCREEFRRLSPEKCAAWVIHQASLLDKKISKEGAELLVSLVGNDTWHLHKEIEKLSHYANGAEITADNIKEVITGTQTGTIFLLTDAIGAKQKKQALALLEQFLQSDTDIHYLFAMIVRQFRLILQAKTVGGTTHTAAALAQRLRLHPFVAQKALEQSKRFDTRELTNIYDELVAIDRLLKSDPDKVRAALTMLIAKL